MEISVMFSEMTSKGIRDIKFNSLKDALETMKNNPMIQMDVVDESTRVHFQNLNETIGPQCVAVSYEITMARAFYLKQVQENDGYKVLLDAPTNHGAKDISNDPENAPIEFDVYVFQWPDKSTLVVNGAQISTQ